MLLGHQPKPVIEAVRAQLERGEIFGTPHEGELELAERIVRLVPCAEMVTFLSSGSETVHLALAIARGATGRRRVLKFDGQFNGWIAPLRTNMPGMPAVGHQPPYAARPDAGWPQSGDEVEICPWNDTAALEAEMERVGDIHMRRGGEIGDLPIFSSPGWLTMRDACMSTSSSSSEHIQYFGFGPTGTKNIGVPYVLLPERLNIYLAAQRPTAGQMHTFAERRHRGRLRAGAAIDYLAGPLRIERWKDGDIGHLPISRCQTSPPPFSHHN